MTKLEERIEAAMKELLEESGIPEIQEPEPEIIAENIEIKRKKRDSQYKRESRKLFRRWRKQAGI